MTLGSCRSDSWFAHSVSVKDQPRTFPKELLQGWAVQRGLDSPGKESSRSQNPLVCHCPGEECGTDCVTPKLDVTGVWKHPDKAEMKDLDTKIFLKRQNKTQQKNLHVQTHTKKKLSTKNSRQKQPFGENQQNLSLFSKSSIKKESDLSKSEVSLFTAEGLCCSQDWIS